MMTSMIDTAAAETTLGTLVDFVAAHGGRWCCHGWSRAAIRDYLAFHAAQRTLAFVTDQPGKIVALAVAWMQHPVDEQRQFSWQQTAEAGGEIVIAEVICTQRGALLPLLDRLFQRWRIDASTNVWTYRKGRLVKLPVTYFTRLARQEVHHGN